LTVDEPQNATDTTKNYVMRVRCQDGTVRLSAVTFVAGTYVGSFSLTTPTPGINPGDLFLFGIQGQDSIQMLVRKIEPSSDLAAKITAVDAAPAVLTAAAGYIDSNGAYHAGVPTLSSSITGQAWIDAPPAPQLIICESGQNLSTINDAGITSPVMAVTVI
jgi:hypothetical protein